MQKNEFIIQISINNLTCFLASLFLAYVTLYTWGHKILSLVTANNQPNGQFLFFLVQPFRNELCNFQNLHTMYDLIKHLMNIVKYECKHCLSMKQN
jgi:hypothetical protein